MAELVDDALTTVSDVKESLGIPSSDHSKDNLIIRKINYVTGLIEAYTGRVFKKQEFTEEHDGSDTDQLVLNNRPIDTEAAITVTRRDTSLNEDDFEGVESNLFFPDAGAGLLNLNFAARGHLNRYKVVYTAGYDPIPADLAEAANALACYFVQNPTGATVGVSTIKEGQRQISYGGSSGSNTTFMSIAQQLGVDQVLDSYANQPLLTSN